MKGKILKDYEGIEVGSGEIFKFTCCDCALTHRIILVSGKRVVGLAMARDKRSTSARRRKK